jgi:hypothetical protein
MRLHYLAEPMRVRAEVRCNADGSLDEVVSLLAPAHLEQLSNTGWFLEIGPVAIWLESQSKITANWEHRGDKRSDICDAHKAGK